MVFLSRPHHFQIFKGCLPQISFGPFLNTLSHIFKSVLLTRAGNEHEIPDKQTIKRQIIWQEDALHILVNIEYLHWETSSKFIAFNSDFMLQLDSSSHPQEYEVLFYNQLGRTCPDLVNSVCIFDADDLARKTQSSQKYKNPGVDVRMLPILK